MNAKELKEIFKYDPVNGLFLRLHPTNAAVKGWSLGSVQPHGYRTFCIKYKKYYAHRLAWLYVYGEFPALEIDHINGNRSDNRIINLRAADRVQQLANACLRSDNKSGFKGVSWREDLQKWVVQIKNSYIGLFDSIHEAANVYDNLAQKQFGPFAKCNFHNSGG